MQSQDVDGPDTKLLRDLVRARMFEPEQAPPVRLGRFAVLSRLGAGAMGVVYAAHDPELDRKVAIKVLTADVDAVELTARLRREAQAMAKLAHPNVVAVHEVGVHDGAPFVAMELVDGTTLRRWLEDTPRDHGEILAMFAAAGAGLAAAHAAGLVHRDFKPDNVLVGIDGRARVGDFGLVRMTAAQPTSVSPRLDGTSTTHSTGMAGTPAYMAPELFAGATSSPEADQYAFCVALFEALVRERPHPVAGLAALAAARLEQPVEFPARPRIRARLQRLLARGLDRDPKRRFPDMPALLAELELARQVPRRWPWPAAAVATAMLAGLFARRDRGPDCAAEAAIIEASWADPQRTNVRAAIEDDAGTTGWSQAIATRVVDRLDAWREAWRGSYDASCRAGRDGTRSKAVLDRQLLCLERRRLELDGFVATVLASETAITGRALQAAVALPSPTICDDVELLLGEPDPPGPDAAAEVARLRGALARAKSQLDVLADSAGALQQSETALAEAGALAYPPLVAEAELRTGASRVASGDLEAAQAVLERAYFDAIAADHDVVALQGAALLLHTIGVRAGRPDDALPWWNHGDALLRKRGHSPREASQLRNSLAAVLSAQGKHADAELVAAQAVADAELGYGPLHPSTFSAQQNLAGAHLGLGEYAEALAIYQQVVAGLEQLYGEDHPATATALANTAIVLGDLDRHAEALAQQEHALAIFERTVGPETMEVGYTLANIANIHGRLGDHAAALAAAERARAALYAALGPDNVRAIVIGGTIGHIQLRLGRLDDARGTLTDTIAALARADPKHPDLPNDHDRLGLVELAAGDCEASLAAHRRAHALAETIGLPPFTLAYQRANAAVALDCLGRPGEALAELDAALAVWSQAEGEHHAKLEEYRGPRAALLVALDRADEGLVLAREDVGRCDRIACDDGARADALVVEAEALLALGRDAEARASADRALVWREQAGGSAWALADARWLAARARHADGVAPAELRSLLAAAHAGFTAAGPRGLRAIASWPAWAHAVVARASR